MHANGFRGRKWEGQGGLGAEVAGRSRWGTDTLEAKTKGAPLDSAASGTVSVLGKSGSSPCGQTVA